MATAELFLRHADTQIDPSSHGSRPLCLWPVPLQSIGTIRAWPCHSPRSKHRAFAFNCAYNPHPPPPTPTPRGH